MYYNKFKEIGCNKDDLCCFDDDNDIKDFINNELDITSVFHRNKLRNAIKKLKNNNNNNIKYMSIDHKMKLNKINILLSDIHKLNETIDKNIEDTKKEQIKITKNINDCFDEIIRAANTKRASLLDKVNSNASWYQGFFDFNKDAINKFKNIVKKKQANINDNTLFIENDKTRNKFFDEDYQKIFGSKEYKLYENIQKWNNKINVVSQFECNTDNIVLKFDESCVQFSTNLPGNRDRIISKNLKNNEIEIKQYLDYKCKHVLRLYNCNNNNNETCEGIPWQKNGFSIKAKYNSHNDFMVEHDVYVDDEIDSFKIYSTKFKILKSVNSNNDLNIYKNETLSLKSDILHKYNNIIIYPNGCLSTDNYNLNTNMGGKLLLKINNKLILRYNAMINLNGKGYPGGDKTENGHGPGKGKYNKNIFGYITIGGGSYGTKYENGGKIYGNEAIDTLYLGSGGACGERSFGGNGGGALKITCKSINIGIKAGIYCNGNGWNGRNCGGGSGGSIHIQCENITNCGQIFAEGGRTVTDLHGGNGRIRIDCNEMNNKYSDITPKPYFTIKGVKK